MSDAPPPMAYADPARFARPRTSVAAVVSLICGIVGCLVVTPFVAVISGLVGIRATRDRNVTGRGMAVAGLVLGILWIVAGIAGVAGIAVVYRNSEAPAAVARQFVGDLAADDVAAAQANATLAPAEVTALRDAIRPWGALTDVTLNNRSANAANGTTRWTMTGTATFATGGTRAASFVLQPTPSGGYRIVGATIR